MGFWSVFIGAIAPPPVPMVASHIGSRCTGISASFCLAISSARRSGFWLSHGAAFVLWPPDLSIFVQATTPAASWTWWELQEPAQSSGLCITCAWLEWPGEDTPRSHRTQGGVKGAFPRSITTCTEKRNEFQKITLDIAADGRAVNWLPAAAQSSGASGQSTTDKAKRRDRGRSVTASTAKKGSRQGHRQGGYQQREEDQLTALPGNRRTRFPEKIIDNRPDRAKTDPGQQEDRSEATYDKISIRLSRTRAMALKATTTRCEVVSKYQESRIGADKRLSMRPSAHWA